MKKIILIISLFTLSFLDISAQVFNVGDIFVKDENFITKEEYIENTLVAPLCTDPLVWNEELILRSSSVLKGKEQENSLYLLVVDNNLYSHIKNNLYKYAHLVTNNTGFDVQIVQVNSTGSAVALRNKLSSLRPSLSGCFFIGDVPYALYQIEGDYVYQEDCEKKEYNSTFPCDLYFMDLDGVWLDEKISPGKEGKFTSGSDGIFDSHISRVSPDIFIGRLPYYSYLDRQNAPMQINQYLERLIRYWKKPHGIKKKALLYIDYDWEMSNSDLRDKLSRISPLEKAGFTIDCVSFFENRDSFNSADYKRKLASGQYSYVNLWAHSRPRTHYFGKKVVGGYLRQEEIYRSLLTPIMYNLFCCRATRWTIEKEELESGVSKDNITRGFLGGAYLYGLKSNTLSLIGSTKSGSMLKSTFFHGFLSASYPIGEAYLNWWKSRVGDFFGGHSKGDISWNYGLSLLGDPLIRLVSPVDLYIQDDINDDGSEPNHMENINYNFWESKDIWIRNQRDCSTEHQNPVYVEGKPVYVYVRIRNRGSETSPADASVTLRWSQAGISLDYDSFLGKNKIGDGIETGGLIGKNSIPSIAPGESVIVCIPWLIKDPKLYENYTKDPWHYCMLAEVESLKDPISAKMQNLRDYVKTYNNVAMKNIYNIEISGDVDGLISGVVSIHNPKPDFCDYNLIVESFGNMDEKKMGLSSVAELSLIPSRKLYERIGNTRVQLKDLNSLQSEHRFIAQSDIATIDNLRLSPGENGLINVKFNFREQVADMEGEYTCRVILKDKETGAHIGGETYIIKKKTRPNFDAIIDHKQIGSVTSFTAKTIDEPAKYRWRDLRGELLHEGKTFISSSNNSVKLEIEAESDGIKGEAIFRGGAFIDNKLKVSPNPAKEQILVTTNGNGKSSLVITSIASGGSYIYSIQDSRVIDISSFPRGRYLFSLFCGEMFYGKQVVIFE